MLQNVDACPICRQWPNAGPLRRAEDIDWDESDWEGLDDDDESRAALKAQLLKNKKQRARSTGAMPLEQRQKISASLKGRKGTPLPEESRR